MLKLLKVVGFPPQDEPVGFLRRNLMKILDKKIHYNGFDFTQMYRDGKFAIYKQTKKKWKSAVYEAIIIESHNGYELAGQKFPPSEMYPSSAQWGIKGFTELTYEDALDKIKCLKNMIPSKKSRKKRKN